MNKTLQQKTVLKIMDSNLIEAGVADSVEKLERMFRIRKAAAFAVILDEESDYYGLVCASRLYEFMMNCKNLDGICARDVCVGKVIAADEDTSVKLAAELLMRKKAEYLVVMRQQAETRTVLGVVSSHHVLRALLLELDPSMQRIADQKGHFAGLY